MTEANETKMTLVGGIDVGNGYVKGVIRGSLSTEALPNIDEVDIPSGVKSISAAAPALPKSDASAVKIMKHNFFNAIDASFESDLVSDKNRKLFGQAGIGAIGSRYVEFQLGGSRGKSEQELSRIIVLGVFAAKAVKDYVNFYGQLPSKPITAEVFAGLALPISEFMAKHDSFAEEFMATTHKVVIKNFETWVEVELDFKAVMVMPEGASAQFAINDKGLPLFELLLADLRHHGFENNDITPRDLYTARRTVGVDIGEGTANFPVFSPDPITGTGAFNDAASMTLKVGYGSVLENARRNMEGKVDRPFESRKALSEFLLEERSNINKSRFDQTLPLVNQEIVDFSAQVVDQLEEVLTNAGSTEVIYIYGGGSGPIKEILYPMVLDRVKGIPICYLDASYSRHLNREGLYLAAKQAAK